MEREPESAMPAKGAVLVTGAAKRIGRAIVLELANAGYAVALHYYQSQDLALELVASIQRMGVNACALQANLEAEAETLELVPRAVSALGPLRALINNASLFERDSALTATREGWMRQLEVNLRAPFVLSQAFARQLPDMESGCIVNMLDQRVKHPTAHYTTYTLSKAGLWTLTQTLALALAPRIRVNALGPGRTLPNDSEMAARFEEHWRTLPLKQGTTPGQIAQSVRFILETPSLTGQMIALDGGEHLM